DIFDPASNRASYSGAMDAKKGSSLRTPFLIFFLIFFLLLILLVSVSVSSFFSRRELTRFEDVAIKVHTSPWCPANGVWSEWVTMGECPTTCGGCSVAKRKRTCTSMCGECPC
ncbi:hypothetical protein PMAYCL1PPCAC_32967, partial [Pristionchus mayeri]